MAGTASAAMRSVYPANSLTQNALTEGSWTCVIISFLYALSDSMRLTPSRVVLGASSRAKSVLVNIYSIRADQASTQIFLNVLIKPETTRWRLVGSTLSRTLNEIGYSTSNGAIYMTSRIRSSGTYSRRRSAD